MRSIAEPDIARFIQTAQVLRQDRFADAYNLSKIHKFRLFERVERRAQSKANRRVNHGVQGIIGIDQCRPFLRQTAP